MAQQGILTNLNGLAFNKGYVYGTRDGGTTDAIEFGALQNIKLQHTLNKVEIEGPESLSPLGVGLKSENVSGSFGFGVVSPEQFLMALGGSYAYDGVTGLTTYTKGVNDEPRPYDLKIQTDISNPEMVLHLFRCVTDNWQIINAENRAWVMGEGAFRVYGEANGGRLYTHARPGNLTNSS